MKDQKHIFFYGGEDTKWIEQFEEKVSAIQKKDRSIVWFHMKNGSEGEDILWKFWNRIESFFLSWNYIKSFLLSEANMKTGSSTVMSTILKLLSCKSESTGWVLLCKGSKLVDSVNGKIILNVLQNFERWKPTPTADFESSFLNYHRQNVNDDKHVCCHIDILEDAAKITEPVKCPFCPRRMKMCSRFYCCPSGNLYMNAQH